MTQNFVRYSPDVEQEEPDFDQTLQAVLEGMRKRMRGSIQAEGIGLMVRDAHAKGYGLARAEVEILGGLTAPYAQGIYSRPGRHEVDPPLGRCGLTDADLRKDGRPALVAKYPMSSVTRAVGKAETQGFIKILVDAEPKQIPGAAILGTGRDEIIHILLDLMYAKAPYTTVQRAMHIHPTVAEFLPAVLGKLEPFV